MAEEDDHDDGYNWDDDNLVPGFRSTNDSDDVMWIPKEMHQACWELEQRRHTMSDEAFITEICRIMGISRENFDKAGIISETRPELRDLVLEGTMDLEEAYQRSRQ